MLYTEIAISDSNANIVLIPVNIIVFTEDISIEGIDVFNNRLIKFKMGEHIINTYFIFYIV